MSTKKGSIYRSLCCLESTLLPVGPGDPSLKREQFVRAAAFPFAFCPRSEYVFEAAFQLMLCTDPFPNSMLKAPAWGLLKELSRSSPKILQT